MNYWLRSIENAIEILFVKNVQGRDDFTAHRRGEHNGEVRAKVQLNERDRLE